MPSRQGHITTGAVQVRAWVNEPSSSRPWRENLALYQKRLKEPHTAAEHEILLKLLAEEKASSETRVAVERGARRKLVPGNDRCS